MIAQCLPHRNARSKSIGLNSLKTPRISRCQGKSPLILGYQAKLPEKGEKDFLSRAKGPVNQWLGT
jgi:hypothetical protein